MEGRVWARTLQICNHLFPFVHDICSYNSKTMFIIIVPILNRFYTNKTLGIASGLLYIQSDRLRHYTHTRNAIQYTVSPWSVSQCCYLFNYALSNKTVSRSVCEVSNGGMISWIWTGKRGKVVVVATLKRAIFWLTFEFDTTKIENTSINYFTTKCNQYLFEILCKRTLSSMTVSFS